VGADRLGRGNPGRNGGMAIAFVAHAPEDNSRNRAAPKASRVYIPRLRARTDPKAQR
jgi:hypothetical protein